MYVFLFFLNSVHTLCVVLVNTGVAGQRFTNQLNVFTHLKTGSACFVISCIVYSSCTNDSFCLIQ